MSGAGDEGGSALGWGGDFAASAVSGGATALRRCKRACAARGTGPQEPQLEWRGGQPDDARPHSSCGGERALHVQAGGQVVRGDERAEAERLRECGEDDGAYWERRKVLQAHKEVVLEARVLVGAQPAQRVALRTEVLVQRPAARRQVLLQFALMQALVRVGVAPEVRSQARRRLVDVRGAGGAAGAVGASAGDGAEGAEGIGGVAAGVASSRTPKRSR
ncbi:hypothetical protein Efla_006021 [Eimeria flavescens]